MIYCQQGRKELWQNQSLGDWNQDKHMSRLFIALDLPEQVKNKIKRICFGLPGARWVAGDQLHLTLRFIGEVDGSMFHNIRAGLSRVKFPELTLTLKGCGVFPSRKKPRLLWTGISGNDEIFQ